MSPACPHWYVSAVPSGSVHDHSPVDGRQTTLPSLAKFACSGTTSEMSVTADAGCRLTASMGFTTRSVVASGGRVTESAATARTTHGAATTTITTAITAN